MKTWLIIFLFGPQIYYNGKKLLLYDYMYPILLFLVSTPVAAHWLNKIVKAQYNEWRWAMLTNVCVWTRARCCWLIYLVFNLRYSVCKLSYVINKLMSNFWILPNLSAELHKLQSFKWYVKMSHFFLFQSYVLHKHTHILFKVHPNTAVTTN